MTQKKEKRRQIRKPGTQESKKRNPKEMLNKENLKNRKNQEQSSVPL
jgi:hypothetical protein